MINWREKLLGGLPIAECRVIDNHNHLGRWQGFHVPGDGTIDQMIRSMDKLGIDQCFVTAHASIGPDYIYGNNMVRDAIDKYPDRVLGYVTINPNYPEDMEHEMDRCFAHKGFRGIKLHPSCHSRAIDYPAYRPVYERAEREGLPILIHVWGSGEVAEVDHLSAEYPNIRFLMGHAGADAEGMRYAMDLINKRDNVYGDTALSTALQGNIEWFVREATTKRILLGSDMPFYDPTHTVARIIMGDFSDEIKFDILGGNMARILDKTDRD